MERKIGEIFEYNGEWYQCVESTACYQCAFSQDAVTCLADNPHCTSRSDREDVIFKKLEKVGEPITYMNRTFQRLKSLDDNICKYCYFKDQVCNPQLCGEVFFLVEIKQNKEDMEEKKIQLKQEDIDYLTRKIRYLVYKTNDYDRATEEIMNLFIPSDTEHSSSEKIGKNLKPFDLEAAKAGKPVCTRDGRKARIIAFDAKGDKPIIVLVEMGTAETPNNYPIDGKAVSAKEASCDLMMLPEKKEGWVNVYKGIDGITFSKYPYPSKEEAIKSAGIMSNRIDTVKINWEE